MAFKKLKTGGTNTLDADATASDVSEGKVAYANNQKITGTAGPYNRTRTADIPTPTTGISTSMT